MRTTIIAVLALALATLTGAVPATSEPTGSADRAAVPQLRVTRQVTGMDIPWDVKSIGGGRLLITERNTGHLILSQQGHKRLVGFPSSKVWVSGETGLMGLAVDPQFATNGRIYTC
jgi:glucose/arabinose dehydrogenase